MESLGIEVKHSKTLFLAALSVCLAFSSAESTSASTTTHGPLSIGSKFQTGSWDAQIDDHLAMYAPNYLGEAVAPVPVFMFKKVPPKKIVAYLKKKKAHFRVDKNWLNASQLLQLRDSFSPFIDKYCGQSPSFQSAYGYGGNPITAHLEVQLVSECLDLLTSHSSDFPQFKRLDFHVYDYAQMSFHW